MSNDCNGVSLSTRSCESTSGKFDSLLLHFLRTDHDRFIFLFACLWKTNFLSLFLSLSFSLSWSLFFSQNPFPLAVIYLLEILLPFLSRVHLENAWNEKHDRYDFSTRLDLPLDLPQIFFSRFFPRFDFFNPDWTRMFIP